MIPNREEGRSLKKRLGDKVSRKKVKYSVNLMTPKTTGTASIVYGIDLYESMGKGSMRTRRGIGKESIKVAGSNASAANLGLRDESNPRMLARQVASWKVARALDLRVLSTEKYALESENKIIGISGFVPNARSLSDEMDYHMNQIDHLTPLEKEDYFSKHVFTGSIQKQLSDLQLIDAITGQTDRHHNNIYIDVAGQKVYGIDNDQAFLNNTNRDLLNAKNNLASFMIPAKLETGTYSNGYVWKNVTKDSSRDLVYRQSQIDEKTAEKILAMDSKKLRQVLEDRVGRAYGEYLTEDEIDAAEKRLEAIKLRIKELDREGKLIKIWDHSTFTDSITKYGDVLTFIEHESVETGNMNQRYQNYIAREIYGVVHSADVEGSLVIRDYDHTEDELRNMYGQNIRITSSKNSKEVKRIMTRNDVISGIVGR